MYQAPTHTILAATDPVTVRPMIGDPGRASVRLGDLADQYALISGPVDVLRQVFEEALSGLVALAMSPDDRQAELWAEAEDAS